MASTIGFALIIGFGPLLTIGMYLLIREILWHKKNPDGNERIARQHEEYDHLHDRR